ncbi:endothelin-converting enzyme/putative endopeptidase [Sphingomonas kyeonggiensis]|uniref:Endothelin-converting enzyme/putative endopeptidase n=1 Tax=Sphingomonas kyeonggiensis TaxID=1268553 RepID=A0A7W7NSL7_9SPHN|nr:M13 family metallopeptidase [Sphingomonas kyeonggiensis]MBB4840440.1 endothelin-converting enzyme/putative endopeptidase [Sphingomonas kyeonggiensis]
MRLSRLAAAALLLGTSALAAPALAQTAPAKPKYGTWGVDYATMDKSVKPGDDFFRFAEGSWLRDAPIAPDKSRAGYNYDLPDETEVEVRTLVEGAGAHPVDPVMRQVSDFYAAWMDEAGIEARGTAPLKPYLGRIAVVNDRKALNLLMAEPGYAAPIGIGISADEKNPTQYTVMAGQARLGLPTRDYYLLQGEKYDTIRKAYRAYVVKIQQLAGIPDAEAKADAILALETRLAQDQWTPEARRDPQKTYNPMTRAQLAKLAPEFDWDATLAHMGLAKMPTVVVRETTAVTAAGKRMADVPLATWKDWLAYRFVSDHAQYLPKAFDDARFDFYSRTLNDVKSQSPRWKRGVRLLDGSLGEAIGKIYAERHWTREAAAQANELVEDLRAAYADKINAAKWMDEPTRKEALAKLAAFDPRLGGPVKYIDYSAMPVSRTDPLANSLASERFDWNLQLSRLGKPVDRTLWDMTPQTVNAYYDPVLNQVTFPAAQLQPPFFDPAADPAVNYGETGATIGHEMGHGFDDEGRQYDASGKLRDWWTKESADRYTAHAQALVKQFDSYEPIPGVHIKGQLTLGENLGDLGGLEAAYAAYRRYVSRHGEPVVIDGYTGDQRFFLAYAQSWQGKAREGALRAQLLSNPHSPEEYRVNGIVRNMDEWYAAFGVKPGDKLYLPPEERVHVW